MTKMMTIDWGEGEQIFDVDEYFTTMTRLKGTISGSDRGPDRGRTWSQTASCRILQQVRSKVSI